ncbi:MAG: sigma-54-dependent Fis family transcriptional regulator [Deltaproteobacteria bacterium]|nr:sigma-54-dependent Fis family transcriptional regulator [Deltaproteobacteria bacterium]
MINYSVYIVDDEKTIREGLTMALQAKYSVSSFRTAESGLEAIGKQQPDLILLDIGLPGMSGIDALREIKQNFPEVLVIMITAYEDINTVISTMKLGAYDYVVKPIQPDSLEISIQNALDTIKLKKEVQALQDKFLQENLPCFIGESNVIQDMIEFMGMVAKSPDTPILILGETGTGKELIASAIHYRSPNYKGPLITVNCPAIPKNLIESELFGYEKGAFTGAKASGKHGLIEEAANGTLFLDEVGDLSLEAQSKMLRFLEDNEFYRVGGIKKVKVETRVVSATNRNLDDMIANDLFRKDLYYRLGVIKIEIPSLNERRNDILPLTKHFVEFFADKFAKEVTGIEQQAESALLEHKWEGNVRELKNIVERAVLTSKGSKLNLYDFGFDDHGDKPKQLDSVHGGTFLSPLSEDGIDLSEMQESVEKYYISEALKISGGNESKAAKLLNINHHTFRYRRRKLGIEPH